MSTSTSPQTQTSGPRGKGVAASIALIGTVGLALLIGVRVKEALAARAALGEQMASSTQATVKTEKVVRGTPAIAHKFGPLQQAVMDGFTYEFVEQQYKEALGWSGFCGGGAETSLWLTRESLVGSLRHLGYGRIEFAFETPDHPNGPALALYAEQ